MKAILLGFGALALAIPPVVAPAQTPDWVPGMYSNVYGRDTVQDLEPAAVQGNRDAQFQLGTGLLYGRGRFPANESEGLRWLRSSAELGQPAAALHLGAYLAEEKGRVDEAIVWLRRAAAAPPANPEAGRTEAPLPAPMRNEIIAARLLGLLLLDGPGATEGVDWLRKASAEDDRISRLILGTAYIDGHGVAKDRAKGLDLILAGRGKSTLTSLCIASLVQAEGVGAPADPKAAAKLLGAKTDSDADVYYHLGRLYQRGFWYEGQERPLVDWYFRRTGVTDENLRAFYKRQSSTSSYDWSDMDRAMHWYRRGADAGHVGAQVNLGLIYFNRNSGHWDCAEGKRWTRMAAERGDPTGQLNLGMALRGACNAEGAEISKDDMEEAMAWIRKSSDAGNLSALYYLAGAYREGKGVPRDPEKAVDYYRKGAERGDWQAAQEVAHMYAKGEGLPQSAELADQWMRKAVQLRHASVGRESK